MTYSPPPFFAPPFFPPDFPPYFAPAEAVIPSVIGETVARASEILEGAGFGISVVYTSVGATAGNNGTAASQSPAAGTTQPLFTVVTVTFYQYIPPAAVSISATRTTPTNVSITYSVTAPSDGGTVTWSISGTGSPYASSQSLSAGATRTETINATVTPSTVRYQYTITASNNGGSVSATAFAPSTNPTAGPTGTLLVSETTSYNTLNVSIGINAPGGLVNGSAYYTVSGPGLLVSGVTPTFDSEAYDFVTDAILSPGVTYDYTLTIYNNHSTITIPGSATPKSVQPPTNPTVSLITATSAFVSWSASATAGATYQVVLEENSGTVNYSSGTSATLTGLTPETFYKVKIRALDSGYASPYVYALRNGVNGFTTLDVKTITATITAVSSTDGTEAEVSWSVTKSNGVTVSILEVYGPDVNAGGELSGTVTARGLSPGGTYTWYIVAVGSYDGAQISDSKSVTLVMNQAVVGAPSAPQDFTATATNTTTVSLTWNPSTSAGGFPPVTYYLSGPGTISTPSTTNNYATVTGLSPGTVYTWYIYAQNTNPTPPNTSATISAFAVTPSVSIGAGVLVPNITATSNAEGTAATVTWSTVSYGTSLYYLESDTTGDGLSFYSTALSGSELVVGLSPGSAYTFRTYVTGFTRSGAPVGGSDSYTVVMSNPSPSPAPAPIADKLYYHNGTTWVQASEVRVYNGSWVSSSIKTSDGQGNWT
jgi:hypothetical protein